MTRSLTAPKGSDDMRSVSIMDAAKLAAQTMRQGGGIGYDFSTLRPGGDMIMGVRAKTDGPIAFMPIYNAVCQATSSAGERRGAQMGVLRCDHPDIMKFITMKTNNDFLKGFNVSVGVTDELMEGCCSQRHVRFAFWWPRLPDRRCP
jgi:ribonucleoside-diphosphate reductase alpha chain